MPRVPDAIAKKFPIAAENRQQARAIPRALLAYSGPEKLRFIAITIALIMNGSLPEYGQKRTWRPGADQQARQWEIAASMGISRETFTRWLSLVATPDDSWDVPRRLKQRDRAREIHQRRGHRLHEGERSTRGHVETFIHRRRQFMRPNRYEPGFGQHLKKSRPGDWFPPRRVDELPADWNKYFSSLPDKDSFKHIPKWLWDAALPLSWTARLTMTYYFMCGLGSKDKAGRVIGTVRPKQATVARELGFGRKGDCVRTVYNANRELAALGLIRVAHEHIKMRDGRTRRGNQIIVYLPIRYLSEEEAAEERTRLQALDRWRKFGVERDRNAWMASRVKELHEARLRAYMSEEHQHPTTLAAFWKQVTHAAIAEGIHYGVIKSLIHNLPRDVNSLSLSGVMSDRARLAKSA